MQNKFSVALWLCILILMASSYRSLSRNRPGQPLGSPSYPSSQPTEDEENGCTIEGILNAATGGLFQILGNDRPVTKNTLGEGLRFERNVGQADSSYNFVAHARKQSILLSSAEAVFQLTGTRKSRNRTVKATLEGGKIGIEPKGENPLGGHVNYLIGRDPEKWYTDIPTYSQVRYQNVYPGIDAVYHAYGRDLETDFVVRPGADPQTIRIHFEGADAIHLETDGSLSAEVESRSLSWKKPVLYQTDSTGIKSPVEGTFKIAADGSVGFEVGVYDVKRPLVIDPILAYETYFGTQSSDGAARVAADASGNAYFVGGSDDEVFPVTPGSFFNTGSGQQGTVVVGKMSPTGSMIYETHIGGSNGDIGFGITLDPSGNVYVTGMTDSSDFPLLPSSNNLTTNSPTDPLNCFVTKINSAGNGLVYSMVMGGSQSDGCSSIGLDASGNAYVTGMTNSTDLPTKNAVQATLPPGALFGTNSTAAFIFKLNAAGTALQYSTYFGGSGNNGASSVAVDNSGNAYFTGFTTSAAFPVSGNALQGTFGGAGGQTNSFYTTGDAYVVKLTPSGALVYSTYLGGQKDDVGLGIAIDAKGDAYIGGATLSTNFPTANAFQTSNHGYGGNNYFNGGDGFITELDPTGSTILFSSYIGGQMDDRVIGIALDSAGNIYLAGHTLSQDFPTAGTQAQPGYAGDWGTTVRVGDAFVAEINTAHALIFSTFIGGSGGDWATCVAVDGTGGIIVVGTTCSPDLPTFNPYQAHYAGSDAFFANEPVGDAMLVRFAGTGGSPVSITGIANAASYVGGSIAPGEALYIAGTEIGPPALATAQLDSTGKVSTNVAGTQFLFNGVAAPIVYVSATQSSVIVPYEVAGSTSAQVVAVYNGTQSSPVTMPVVASLPGVFSANSSGTGQGAIFNQNLTPNTSINPAPRNSTVVLYVTGEGQTMPAGIDGSVTGNVITPVLPVTVSFGGVPATSYQFIGESPGVVAGVLQINVTVPAGANVGNLPVTVKIGSATSQAGVTAAIQ